MKLYIKQFVRLIDAINYRTRCPRCQGDLCINETNLAENYDVKNPSQKIAFEVLIGSDEILYIDPITNETELIIWDQGNKIHSSKRGSLGHGLTLECKCNMYSFTIQVWVDLNTHKINSIILNSERVSWEDDLCTLHEITATYTTNTIKYNYFHTDASEDDGHIVLPLIPLDINNPENTLSRIRKLLVFS